MQPKRQSRDQLGLELDLQRRDRLAARGAVGTIATAGPRLAGLVAGNLAGLDELANAEAERDLFQCNLTVENSRTSEARRSILTGREPVASAAARWDRLPGCAGPSASCSLRVPRSRSAAASCCSGSPAWS